GAASAYVRDRITNLKVGMFLEVFTIVGALAGAGITIAAPRRPLFILFGSVLLASWVTLFAQRHEHWRPVARQDKFSQWLELAGTSVYLAAGFIDPGPTAPVMLSVLLGAFVGTRLLVRLSNQAVRRFFLVMLAVLGIEMILRGIRGV